MVRGIGSIPTGSVIAGAGTPPTARAGSPVSASGYGGLFSGRAAPPSSPRFLYRTFLRDRARHQSAAENAGATVPIESAAATGISAGGALAAGLTDSKKTLLPLTLATSTSLLNGCATLEEFGNTYLDNPSALESALLAFACFAGFGVAIFLIVVGLGIGDRFRFGRWK